MLVSFIEILTEALNIFCRNGKFMASFTLLSLSLYSILYLFNLFSFKYVIPDRIFNQSFLLVNSLNSPEYANLLFSLYEDRRILTTRDWIFFLLGCVVSFYFSTSTILAASASTRAGKILSLHDLLLLTARSGKRPFITLLYITIFNAGYFLLGLAILLHPLLNLSQYSPALQTLYIVLCFAYSVFYIYMTVFWNLALVISVLEENYYGIEALRMGAKIVQGMGLQGFLVNVLITILCLSVLLGIPDFSHMSLTDISKIPVMMGLILLHCIWVIRMFGLMAYTILYYQGIDLEGSLGFSGNI